MATPFACTGSLEAPVDTGLAPTDVPCSSVGSFDARADFVLKLGSSGTENVDLGTIKAPGVKALLLKVGASATAPIIAKFNAQETGIELSPGGWILYCSPSPVQGITGLQIVFTSDVTVSIWALG